MRHRSPAQPAFSLTSERCFTRLTWRTVANQMPELVVAVLRERLRRPA